MFQGRLKTSGLGALSIFGILGSQKLGDTRPTKSYIQQDGEGGLRLSTRTFQLQDWLFRIPQWSLMFSLTEMTILLPCKIRKYILLNFIKHNLLHGRLLLTLSI
jgi:hypothetical protein